MRKFQINKQYLCGIGNYKTKKVDKYEVGTYDGLNFYFSNGSYSPYQLYFRKKIGSNITCVLTAKRI